MDGFGEKLKELRLGKNMTTRQLAAVLEVNRSLISFWEANRNEPKISYLYKISKFFDVSADYLLGIKDY